MKKTEIFPKSHFKMKITYLKKTIIKEDDKETESFKIVDSKWINGNGKELRDSIFEDRKKGLTRTIEIVNEPPTKFKFNQLYMSPLRDRVWIFTEKENDINE